MRTLHDMTRRVADSGGSFSTSVTVSLDGLDGGGAYPDDSAAGLLVGVGRGEMDVRSASIVHQWGGYGAGLFVGVDGLGQCFIVDNELPWTVGGGFDAGQALPRRGWTASAASQERDGRAGNVLDGDPSTIWHTEFRERRPGHPHELLVNLAGEQTFAALAYLPRQNNDSGRVGAFDLYASLDGNTWGEPIASGEFPNSADLQIIRLPETRARFVKLVAKSAQRPQPAATVAELWLLREFIEPGDEKAGWSGEVRLEVSGEALDDANYGLTVKAVDPETGRVISSAAKTVSPERVLGNVALVSHPGGRMAGATPARFGFERWTVEGDAVERSAEHAVGPVLGTQYTLTRGTLKMTAQLMPLGEADPATAVLQIDTGGGWIEVASAQVIAPGYTATFRVDDWDSALDTPYRVVYRLPDGELMHTYAWHGTVRRDPVDRDEIVVAGFTGNHMNSLQVINRKWNGEPDHEAGNWVLGMYYPHAGMTEKVAAHRPDLLFFSGDQVYEGGSPTFPDLENIELDYLYKWYLFMISYRGLMKDIPTVTIPDDHDVYQGNIWGQGGRKSPGRDHDGGYVRPASFVQMVHRTQVAHLPDPVDATPIEQGISYYTCDVQWGRVGFAVFADRMFKNGCNGQGLPASGTGRPDHYNNPAFDTADLDLPGMKLLGDRQLAFLKDWSGDWSGVDMKMALSQTIFANMATHHGGNLGHLIADLDSNGWPQTGRNKALAELRRGFALHLAGDQHLATLVHHGIDEHRDSVWSFCVPSVANFYPRAWAPEITNPYEVPEDEAFTGDRLDGFKNRVTVYAATNPGRETGYKPAMLHDRMPGYGIVRVNTKDHTYTAECWPRYADPTDDAQQYPGWPRTIDQLSNYSKRPAGYLPMLQISGLERPVVHVINQQTGELVYALRLPATTFSPMVFEQGRYNVIISDPDLGVRRSLIDIEIAEEGETIEVAF
ncbi:MAG: discoidin domain-containing protein [Planctomycetota bacterium]